MEASQLAEEPQGPVLTSPCLSFKTALLFSACFVHHSYNVYFHLFLFSGKEINLYKSQLLVLVLN